MHQYRALGDTLYLYFASNNTSGSGADGASAAAYVREGGASAGAAPVLSPSPTLLTHANYAPGAYEVAVAATSANGFTAGTDYGVFATLAVDSQNPLGFIGSFTLDPVNANVKEISDDVTAADNMELMFDGTGYAGGTTKFDVNVASIDDIDAPATWKASINTEVDNSMVTYGLDHLVSTSVTGTDVANNSIIAYLVSDNVTADWDDYDNTNQAPPAISSDIATALTRLGSPIANWGSGLNISSNIFDLAGGATFSPSTDTLEDILNAVGGLNDISTADVNAQVDAALNTAIPGSPTAGSINERIKTMDDADIPGRLPAALTGAGNMKSDALAFNGNTTAAANQALAALGIITGSAATGTLSTTQASTDLTGYADDQLIGAFLVWTSGACDGERTEITDYANTNGVLTFNALTTAPANGDTFVIV